MSVHNFGTALITGASSGIGAAFARQLAVKRKNLILVARGKERLVNLANDLRQHYGITTEILAADLSNLTDIEQVESRIGEIENLDMLVNNAGFGTVGRFGEIDLSRQIDMINVHIVAGVRLCRAALPGMIARHNGAIINVSSIAAFIPTPGNATYSATKAYLATFSQALQTELAGTSVKVQALCPGFTYTEFHDSSEYEKFDRSQIPKMLWMSAEEVVTLSLKALGGSQVTYIPGFKNRLLVAMARNSITSPLLLALIRRKLQK